MWWADQRCGDTPPRQRKQTETWWRWWRAREKDWNDGGEIWSVPCDYYTENRCLINIVFSYTCLLSVWPITFGDKKTKRGKTTRRKKTMSSSLYRGTGGLSERKISKWNFWENRQLYQKSQINIYNCRYQRWQESGELDSNMGRRWPDLVKSPMRYWDVQYVPIKDMFKSRIT